MGPEELWNLILTREGKFIIQRCHLYSGYQFVNISLNHVSSFQLIRLTFQTRNKPIDELSNKVPQSRGIKLHYTKTKTNFSIIRVLNDYKYSYAGISCAHRQQTKNLAPLL